jgi:ribosomal 50S subunit-associated protein YjgA (DUF615 family)
MTQEEKDAILGRTRREYREARAELGSLKKRHAELVSDLKQFVGSLEREPMSVHVLRVQGGTLQAAMETQGANYLYTAILANRLTLDAIEKHTSEYRAALETVEDRRKSLIDQGDGDPGSIERSWSIRSSPVS